MAVKITEGVFGSKVFLLFLNNQPDILTWSLKSKANSWLAQCISTSRLRYSFTQYLFVEAKNTTKD
jgi:hypothetical protein